MCGITGFFSKDKSLTSDNLLVMNQKVSHRGPDADGIYIHENVGLGHRRLSILDLSVSANQPMRSSDGRYVIAFNGEVYNFKEIANDLGLQLKTTSDTEVILEAFVKEGVSCVNRMNGMFAFAIYDSRDKILFLFRDRMGVKPLFYYWDGNNFAFSSEIKSLLAVKDNLPSLQTVNTKALSQLLYLGYIPEPDTAYSNIKKFPSGAYLKISSNEFKIESYWSLESKINNTLRTGDLPQLKSELKDILESSIKYRLISDVPLGTFLSGGIDSSLVTAIAQKYSSKRIKTFSIGFKDSRFNETEYSKTVSKHLNTDHYPFDVTEKEALDAMQLVFDNFDEPYLDESAIPTYYVSKLARKEVTVVLTGDGGDELFMGYGSYMWADRLSRTYARSFKSLISILLSSSRNNTLKRASTLFQYSNYGKIRSHIASQEQYLFNEKELKKLFNKGFYSPVSLMENFKNLSRKLSPMEEQALFDLKYYLKDDLLVKVDRASMLCSLEAREPLLDYRLVEFALNIPQKFKYTNGVSKYLLKEVLFDYLPQELFNRPKWGFSIPLQRWLKGELSYLIDEYLSPSAVVQTGLFNVKEVNQLLSRFKANEGYLYKRIFALIMLQRWFMNNGYTVEHLDAPAGLLK